MLCGGSGHRDDEELGLCGTWGQLGSDDVLVHVWWGVEEVESHEEHCVCLHYGCRHVLCSADLNDLPGGEVHLRDVLVPVQMVRRTLVDGAWVPWTGKLG